MMAFNSTATQMAIVDDTDKDEYYYFIKRGIYQACKDGFSMSLQNIINHVDDVAIKTILVNQVKFNICKIHQ